MKYLLIGLVISLTTTLSAQTPEKVYSITKEVREMSWYLEQQKAWESEISKDKKNGDAWINYYAAARAMRNIAPKSEQEKYRSLCKEVVEKCGKAIPKSFEYHYLNYRQKGAWNGGDELLKAEKIRPNAPELVEELMIYHELQRNTEKHIKYAKRMFEANEMAPGQLNWGYNILAELDENAILFTYGDNDTYAPWVVSAAKNFRPDVTIINTSLIRVDYYREKLFEDMGLPKMDKIDKIKSQQEYHDAGTKIIQHIMKSKRPMFFGTSCGDQFQEAFGDNMYLTGLTYKYCEESFDNTAVIKRNYEKRYKLDYITQTFSYHIANNQVPLMNATYLPSMVKLHRHYVESEDLIRQKEMKELLMFVAKNSGKEEEVRQMIEGKN